MEANTVGIYFYHDTDIHIFCGSLLGCSYTLRASLQTREIRGSCHGKYALRGTVRVIMQMSFRVIMYEGS